MEPSLLQISRYRNYIKTVGLKVNDFIQQHNIVTYYCFNCRSYIPGFLKEHTEERGLEIIDRLIDIIQTLYKINVDVTTMEEKVAYLSSLNSSFIGNLTQKLTQNSENISEVVDDITNNDNEGYSMKFWLTLTWDLLFFIIIFVAIVGNLLVLWIVTGKEY